MQQSEITTQDFFLDIIVDWSKAKIQGEKATTGYLIYLRKNWRILDRTTSNDTKLCPLHYLFKHKILYADIEC